MSELNILYGCDDNYAPYTGVSMTSLFENNKELDKITVYFAGDKISKENTIKFNQLAKQYGREVVWLDTELAMKRTLQYNCKGWNGSLATWLRFFVLEQIPDNVKQLLWLDSDTLVVAELGELVNLNLDEYAVAAVGDCVSTGRKRTGLKETDTYFNAGVILFNMDYWRGKNILKKMMIHLQKNVERYTANDQDLLNDYLKGKIKKIDLKYNCQGFLLAYDTKDYLKVFKWKENAFYSYEEIMKAKRQPSIIHFFRFLGDYPWTQGNNYHPIKGVYEEWLEQSLWKECKGAQRKNKIVFEIEKKLYKVLPNLWFLKLFYLMTGSYK